MPAPVPPDVEITREARAPVEDPTLGIEVAADAGGTPDPPHRLVTIGDFLLHGMRSGAVHRTDLSAPAIVAYELGCLDTFRHPAYGGPGGLPLNLELLLRVLEERYGSKLDWWEVPLALFTARQWMDDAEDYWERGPGCAPRRTTWWTSASRTTPNGRRCASTPPSRRPAATVRSSTWRPTSATTVTGTASRRSSSSSAATTPCAR